MIDFESYLIEMVPDCFLCSNIDCDSSIYCDMLILSLHMFFNGDYS